MFVGSPCGLDSLYHRLNFAKDKGGKKGQTGVKVVHIEVNVDVVVIRTHWYGRDQDTLVWQ